MTEERRTCVWPLVAGLEAHNAIGQPVLTQIGRRAFMPMSHALNLEAQGKVELMVGKRPEHLTRVLEVHPPEDLDSVVDEEPPPPPPPQRPRKTTKKTAARRTYGRRDMKAES